MSGIPLTAREQKAWDSVNAYREQHGADIAVSAALTALGLGPRDSAAYYQAKRKLVGKSSRRMVRDEEPEREVTLTDALQMVIEALEGFDPEHQTRILRAAMAYHSIEIE